MTFYVLFHKFPFGLDPWSTSSLHHVLLETGINITRRLNLWNVGKEVEKLEPSCIAGGKAEWCSHLGKWSSTFWKVQHPPIICPTIPTPRDLHKRNGNVGPYKVLGRNVYSSLIMAQTWREPKCPKTDGRTKRTSNSIGLSNQKKETPHTCYHTDATWKYYTRRTETTQKGTPRLIPLSMFHVGA